MGVLRRFGIYFPASYGYQSEPHPVLYLFRGHECEWVGRQDGRPGLIRTLDHYIASPDATRFVVVLAGFMENSRMTQGVPVNWSADGKERGVGNGRFEDHFYEIKDWVEANCRVGQGRGYAALDGFSMGGYSSMFLATSRPDLFGSAGAYDPSLMWEGQLDTRESATGKDDILWFSDTCAPYFRRAKTWDRRKMERHNPLALITKANGKRLSDLRSLRFHVRSAADERIGNVDRTRHFVEALEHRGLNNTFDGPELLLDSQARHSWYWADYHLTSTLPLHAAALQKIRRTPKPVPRPKRRK